MTSAPSGPPHERDLRCTGSGSAPPTSQTAPSELTGSRTNIGGVTNAADESWMQAGRCAGLDTATFFPSDGVGVIEAIQICRTCSVQQRCLDYALENGITIGVWGGVSERGRQKLRRSAARRAAEGGPTPGEPQPVRLASPSASPSAGPNGT